MEPLFYFKDYAKNADIGIWAHGFLKREDSLKVKMSWISTEVTWVGSLQKSHGFQGF